MKLIKEDLQKILVCPSDKGELRELLDESKLECIKCGRRYPVREGIPVMLINESEMPEKDK